MRTVNFRDEGLYYLARKMGLDPGIGQVPGSTFLSDLAQSYAIFLSIAIKKLLNRFDWPDFVLIEQRVPDARHYIAFQQEDELVIERALKVYPRDPAITYPPTDMPFRQDENGIHVGFDHGINVWLKYMPLAPRYTADPWVATREYKKGELTYSPRSGECYRSKSDGNLGIDPSIAVGPGEPPTVTIIQPYIPPTPASPGQSKIMELHFIDTTPPVIIPDPAPIGYEWVGSINSPTTPHIGTFFFVVSGVPITLLTMLTDVRTDLDTSLPPSFTVTAIPAFMTLRIEDLSEFSVNSGGTFFFDGVKVYYLNFDTIQLFIPPVIADPGQPQIIRLTMTTASTVPGATYRLVLTDSSAAEHMVEYESSVFDNAAAILNGLVLAIQTSPDPYWSNVQLALNSPSLDFSVTDSFSLQPSITLLESPWWSLMPFPESISDLIVRLAFAEALREDGQFDKANLEEQGAIAEAVSKVAALVGPPFDTITDQSRPASRYRQPGFNIPIAAGGGK